MELISLRIRTKEAEYGQVLATVLRRNYPGFLITSSVIGEEGEAAAAGSTGSWGYDLGLCDDRASLQDGDVLLVDSPALETVGADGSLLREEGPVCVFKYAPAREMIEKILGLCSARMHRRIFRPRGERCRIIGVFSGAGGKGCTTLSLALAQYGARLRGIHPLIVPMGQFADAAALAPAGSGMPLREYLYRTLRTEGATEQADYLERAVAQDAFGTGRFAGQSGENPLYRLSGEGMQTVLCALSGGTFDYLFADIGTTFQAASFAVLAAADKLVMLSDSPAKDNALFEYLRANCGGGVLQKMIPVINRSHRSVPTAVDRFYEEEGEAAALQTNCFRIPYEPCLDLERGSAKDAAYPLEGGFADAVEDLLTALDRDS